MIDKLLLESFYGDVTKVVDEEKGGYNSLLFSAKCLLEAPISPIAKKRNLMVKRYSAQVSR